MNAEIERYLELGELMTDPNVQDGSLMDDALDEMESIWQSLGPADRAELDRICKERFKK